MQPSYLQKGDKIAIVATAKKVNKEDVLPSVEIMKQWGLDIVLGENLFKENNQFAGTDEERTQDLQAALDDDSIKAVIIARGGYGTVKIIDNINFAAFKKQPKWVVGYSDITVLHSHLHNLGFETLHATMPLNFSKNTEAVESLRKALFGEALEYVVPAFELNKKGKTKAPPVGGNLSILYSLLGSNSDISTKDKILFIEDLDEYLYHLDRMMMALKRAGKLDQLKGLIVGGMTDMKDNIIPFGKTAEEIIFDAVKEYDYPVCFNFPAGHIDRNMALIMGREAELNIDDTGTKLAFKR